MSIGNWALIIIVRSHLQEDKRLAGQPIDVISSDGYIKLVGRCDTREQKRLAVMLAQGIVGVRNVEDQIQVRKIRYVRVV